MSDGYCFCLLWSQVVLTVCVVHSCCLGTGRDRSLDATKVELIHKFLTVCWVNRPSPAISVADHTLEEFDFFFMTRPRPDSQD